MALNRLTALSCALAGYANGGRHHESHDLLEQFKLAQNECMRLRQEKEQHAARHLHELPLEEGVRF